MTKSIEVKNFSSLYLAQNSSVVFADGCAVVIDPGVLPEEGTAIAAWLAMEKLRLEAILFTHSHGDHFAGWQYLPPAPLYISSRVLRKDQQRRNKDVAFVASIWRGQGQGENRQIVFPADLQTVADGNSIHTQVADFFFYHTPGHAIDQALIVAKDTPFAWSGDMLIRSSYPFILESFFQYRLSLGHLRRQISAHHIGHLIPGHYQVAKGAEIHQRIDAEMLYVNRLYQYLFDHYRPHMDKRQLEEMLLHIDQQRIKVHFTHKMNVNRLVDEISSLL
jgi:glyoxylase-like metal-dependent hydrolase (beta-lactamase superfamily II)